MSAGTFTYDPSTDAGRVRLLVGDIDEDRIIFNDDEIGAFLAFAADNDPRMAAAVALEAIANDQAMTLKVIRLLDLTTDGAATAAALRAGADRLRDAYLSAQLPETAEMVLDDHTAWEIIWNAEVRA